MDNGSRLVQMANDIGNFFRAQPNRDEAITGIANHIKSYWTKRMVEKLVAQVEEGHMGLDDLPLAAVTLLRRQPAPTERQPTGGDAG